MKKYFILGFLFFLVLSGCRKEENLFENNKGDQMIIEDIKIGTDNLPALC